MHGKVEYDHQHNYWEDTSTVIVSSLHLRMFPCLRPFIFSSVNPHRQIWLITKSSESRAISLSTKRHRGDKHQRHSYAALTLLLRPATNNTTNCWSPDPRIYSHPSANEDPDEQLHADHHHLRIHPSICVVKVQDAPRVRTASAANRSEWEL